MFYRIQTSNILYVIFYVRKIEQQQQKLNKIDLK